ncbi:hypothetical protein Goari_015280 [Gossypium aridum]|uniref:Uncharacterized protein n=1 Tax=Gossypium aridum TaxID=34290 RepID=A0A7J8XKJ8_GOSAI|nr:hypothetical protein [Gossypium aridum]
MAEAIAFDIAAELIIKLSSRALFSNWTVVECQK